MSLTRVEWCTMDDIALACTRTDACWNVMITWKTLDLLFTSDGRECISKLIERAMMREMIDCWVNGGGRMTIMGLLMRGGWDGHLSLRYKTLSELASTEHKGNYFVRPDALAELQHEWKRNGYNEGTLSQPKAVKEYHLYQIYRDAFKQHVLSTKFFAHDIGWLIFHYCFCPEPILPEKIYRQEFERQVSRTKIFTSKVERLILLYCF